MKNKKEKTNKLINFRTSEIFYKRLSDNAIKEKRTLSNFIRFILEEKLKEKNKNDK